MATHLILTVGKNPLPVWVAWDRLTAHWREKGQGDTAVQFVYTKGAQDEKELLRHYCSAAGATVLGDILTSQRAPDQSYICRKIIGEHRPEFTNLHVHYTGGTQAMGVATVCAMLDAKIEIDLRAQNRDVSIDTSYLDPGRDSAPMIVSWASDPLIEDTRVGVPADIEEIAKINGFKAGNFKSKDPPHLCPSPRIPTEQELLAGQTVLERIGQFDEAAEWHNWQRKWIIKNKISQDHQDEWKWNQRFRPYGFESGFIFPSNAGSFSLPITSPEVWNVNPSVWQDEILPAITDAYPACPWDTQNGLLSYPASGSTTKDQEEDLKQMDAFFNGIWLEYAAYAAFKEVLDKVKCNSGGRRDNFQLFHNVYVRQQGTKRADRHFELDVVAVLGYQVVVISCSVTSRISTVKQKAMEAYHRARQLGGAEARAVVLCLATYEDAERVEKELEDETGTERPLQVWGRQRGERSRQHPRGPAMPGNIPNMDSLRGKFRKLLFDGYDNANKPQHLHWE